VSLPVVPAPPTPADVRPEAAPDGVRLTWSGGPGEYHVFRRAGEEKSFTEVAKVEQPEWTDREAAYGKPYSYVVQRRVTAGNHVAESELSQPVEITPQDKFPPAAPGGLRAIAATQSIELAWDRSPEPDLAGYRVYRAAGEGAFEKLADTSQLPAYSDRAVEAGKTYRYQITAVDQAGNESPRSPVVAATL
jgi:fibronectin type 3 domain-containing protein